MAYPPPTIPDYELLRRIGRGSYGDVWLGRSVTGQFRAVKVVYRDRFESGRPFDREFAGIQRFESISRAHPSQLDVFHVGRNDSAGFFFYVMELADDATGSSEEPGTSFDPESYEPLTLKTVLERRDHLPVREVLELAEPLAEALQYLHAGGLIHRDVKPSNIIFVRGRPKLADIGLITVSEASLSYVGTEGFVPREGPGTDSADLFALGKVIYEAATGRDRMEFPRLPERLEGIPDRNLLMELNEVWLKACDPDAKHRYASAAEMRNDLALLKARKSVRRLRLLERQVRRGRKLIAATVVAGLVIGYGWWQSHRFNRYAASQLSHVYVQHGQERLEQGDTIGALPWFAAAMKLESFDKQRERVHRLRIANTLAGSPGLSDLYVYLANPMPRYVYFNDSGSLALVCDSGNTAQVWDVKTGTPVTPKLKHHSQVRRGWFNADSTRVATLSDDGLVRLWDASSGELKGGPFAHPPQATSACFSPDGRELYTAGADGRIASWNAEGRREDEKQLGFPISKLVASPDGRWLAAAGDERKLVAIVNRATLRARAPFIDLSSGPRELAFDAPGTQLAVGFSDGSIDLWRLNPAPRQTHHLQLADGVFKLSFLHQGKQVLAGSEHTVAVFDLNSSKPIFPVISDVSSIRVLELSPDKKRILIAGESRTARILDAATGVPLTPPLRQAGEIAIGRFAGSGDEWLTASADRTTRRWVMSPATRKTIRLLHEHDVVGAWKLPREEKVLTVDVDGVTRLWSWPSNCVESVTRKSQGPVVLAELAQDGRYLVTLSAANNLMAREPDKETVVATQTIDPVSSPVLTLNPGQPIAYFGGAGYAGELWNWQSNQKTTLAIGERASAAHASFSPDGRLLAVGTSGGELLIWKTDEPGRLPIREKLSDRSSLVAFTSDGGRLLAATEDRSFQWWDPVSGKPLSKRLHAESGVNFARVSPDATRVFTAGVNFEAMTWDTLAARALARPFRPHGQIVEACFSPDASQLALISRDGAVQLWDAASGEPLGPLMRGTGRATSCAFSEDGKELLVIEEGRTVVVHRLLQEIPPAAELADRAALISSYRLDRDGLPQPVDVRELRDINRRLSKH